MKIKKVLLLGDFSSVHLNLRDGLRSLGVESIVVSEGDGFKGYENDINIDASKYNSFIGKAIFKLKILKLLSGFDVVQSISPGFGFGIWKTLIYIKYLRTFNKKIFSLICSPDFNIWQKYKQGLFDYSPYSGLEKDLKIRKEKIIFDEQPVISKRINNIVLKNINGLISTSSEYHLPYEMNSKHIEMIPFPINTDKVKYEENIIDGRVRILHGIQKGRENTKGSPLILKALEIIKEKYKQDVEIVTVHSLPFKEWQKLLLTSNVVIDQTNCFAPGMNALLSMAIGRVVLTGAEDQFLNYHRYKKEELPFFNIKPEVEHIVKVLDDLMAQTENFKNIGHNARLYIETNHDYKKIAQQYLEVWSSN